jgi:hypothetical protein
MKIIRPVKAPPPPPPDSFDEREAPSRDEASLEEYAANLVPPPISPVEKALCGLLLDNMTAAERAKPLTETSAVASTDAPPDAPLYPRQCEECGERFRDESAFHDHLRSDEERNPPSVKFLRGAPLLERCRSPKALWSAGWVRVEAPRKGIPRQKRSCNGVWQQPVVKLRPHVKVPPESAYKCVLCKQVFKEVHGFQAHHVHTHTSRERCLDAHELRALLFEQSAAGVWRIALTTQYLPSQIARLASVRIEAEALERDERAEREAQPAGSAAPEAVR